MAEDTNTIVTLQNIDDEDFMFEYNASEGNPPYLIPAGEVARFPKFLAEHALKHLIDRVLNKRNERTNNETLRLELANQIIIGEETLTRATEPSEQQKIRMQVEELNKPSTLDAILEKRKEEKVYKKEIKKAEGEEIEVGERFEGLDKLEPSDKADPAPVEAAPKVEPKEVKSKPTRNELFAFAEKEMNMIIDKKTKSKFTKMTIDNLIKELQYPMEE